MNLNDPAVHLVIEIVLGLAGGLLTIAIGVIAYFLKVVLDDLRALARTVGEHENSLTRLKVEGEGFTKTLDEIKAQLTELQAMLQQALQGKRR